jgi:hypothetical protein
MSEHAARIEDLKARLAELEAARAADRLSEELQPEAGARSAVHWLIGHAAGTAWNEDQWAAVTPRKLCL